MQSFCLRLSFALLLMQIVLTTAEEVCYDKYGCFSDDPPFNTKILSIFGRRLPESPKEMETKYFLFTREDRIGQITLDDSNAGLLEGSTYNGARKTILIIHGWTGKPLESPWVKAMKDALLEKEDVNVIVTGWKEGAGSLWYPKAVGNSRLVGAMVAEFIKFLNKETDNTPDTFHVIGFSLGAQVAGYAGKRFQEITEKKIARITGLDPASPGYKGEHIDVRLDATDGAFVDVIHSDCPRVGTPSKSGKFDFWPNGGGTQPGCLIKKKKCAVPKSGIVDSAFKLVGCEHYRAHQYFIESIKSSKCLFRSYPCESWSEFIHAKCMDHCGADGSNCPEMGYNAYKYKDLQEGDFYLYTNDKPQYCVPRYMYVNFETGSTAFGLAGTGYNPRVKIYGSNGDTGEIKLKGKLPRNSNERFVVPIKAGLGELKSVAVHNHRNYNIADPWNVQKVTLQYVDGLESYSACFDTNVYRPFKKRDLKRGNAQCKRKHVVKRPKKRQPKLDHEKIEKKQKMQHEVKIQKHSKDSQGTRK